MHSDDWLIDYAVFYAVSDNYCIIAHTPRTMSMYPKKPSRFGTHIPILGLNFEAISRPDDKMENKDEYMLNSDYTLKIFLLCKPLNVY